MSSERARVSGAPPATPDRKASKGQIDPFVALGRRYARAAGFKALKPGEKLPRRWYLVNPSTGKSKVKINDREESAESQIK